MNHHTVTTWMRGRAMAAVACAALAAPMIGCGSGGSSTAGNASGANLPPIDDTRGGAMASSGRPSMGQPTQPQRTGLSGKQKVVLLVGAAALYYLYRKHQKNAANQTAAQKGEPIYYLSKNGRVYYRDANAQAHYVTPPPQGVEVPADEAQAYQGLQGYDRSTTGETDLSRFATQNGGM